MKGYNTGMRNRVQWYEWGDVWIMREYDEVYTQI